MSLGLAILSCALVAGVCHPAADAGVRSFAVRVTARAGTVVRLRTLDVPRGWLASFCSPRVCSPGAVSLPVRDGRGAIQLSYVPIAAGAPPVRALHLAARDAFERVDARRAVSW